MRKYKLKRKKIFSYSARLLILINLINRYYIKLLIIVNHTASGHFLSKCGNVMVVSNKYVNKKIFFRV